MPARQQVLDLSPCLTWDARCPSGHRPVRISILDRTHIRASCSKCGASETFRKGTHAYS